MAKDRNDVENDSERQEVKNRGGQLCDCQREKKRGKNRREEQEECGQGGGRRCVTDGNGGEKSRLNVEEEERGHTSMCS